MTSVDSIKYLLPILTSYVKENHIHLALKAVQIVAGNIFCVEVLYLFQFHYIEFFLDESIKDSALKYLSVLVDSAKLYTEALATYDLQLTLMVAQRSQMVLLIHLQCSCMLYKYANLWIYF